MTTGKNPFFLEAVDFSRFDKTQTFSYQDTNQLAFKLMESRRQMGIGMATSALQMRKFLDDGFEALRLLDTKIISKQFDAVRFENGTWLRVSENTIDQVVPQITRRLNAIEGYLEEICIGDSYISCSANYTHIRGLISHELSGIVMNDQYMVNFNVNHQIQARNILRFSRRWLLERSSESLKGSVIDVEAIWQAKLEDSVAWANYYLAASRARHDIFEILLKLHQPLVKKILFKLKPQNMWSHSFSASGNLGLFEAIRNFHPESGLSITTFAWNWIYGAVTEEFDALSMNIVSRHDRRMIAAIGRLPANSSERQIAESLGVSELVVARLKKIVVDKPCELLNEHIENMLDDSSPVDDYSSSKFINRLLGNTLNSKELKVIKGRFWDERTLQDLGDELGISRERTRQIEENALGKLAKHKQVSELRLLLSQ